MKISEIIPKFITNVNWIQFWFIGGFLTTAWLGIAYFVPDHIFKPVAVVVTLIQSQCLFVMRAGKYVVNREEPLDNITISPPQIPDGKPPA